MSFIQGCCETGPKSHLSREYQEEDEEEAVNRAIIESEIFVSQLFQFFSIFFFN